MKPYRRRFLLAYLVLIILALGAVGFTYALTVHSPSHSHYLIDPVAWGQRAPSAHGRWLILGPKGDPTSRVGFVALWHHIRVEDHQAFREPFAPTPRIRDCRATFETEGLRVVAFSCRKATLVSVVNELDQPRAVLVEGF